MMTRTKMHSTKQNDPPAGFRIHPNGTVEVLTEVKPMAIISRASARRWLRRGGGQTLALMTKLKNSSSILNCCLAA